jgi:ABC-2 type transport system ATP-binding protein
LLNVEHLEKDFGPIHALRDVCARFRQGALTILAGADGSGKSTLLKIIIGLIKADKGEIFLHGDPLKGDFKRIASITGYMPERFSLYTDLSVEENMNFFADIQGVARKRREDLKRRLLEKTGMWEFRKRRAGALSGGMKQKLSLSAILLSSPQIILLDEPTTGVDPLSRIEFFRIIDELKEEGRMIIASTPYLDEAEKGDDILFFKGGRVIHRGSIAGLKRDLPARIYTIRPRGPIFDALEILNSHADLKGKSYVKGRHIKILVEDPAVSMPLLSSFEPQQVPATLEDIFLYYERRGGAA